MEEKIGSGAMGTVYRATHETLGKEVALKLVEASNPDGEMCQRFLLEGVAASRVRHPNVVEVLDAGVQGRFAFLAMQLLEGETLAECLKREGRLPITYAIDLLLPVCAALAAAHAAGVLHRDLKPANIFLAEVGRGEPEPMLLDFGISKIMGPVDAELTENPRFLGTPLYIAPEQADGAAGTELSDQYSLALSLYEMLLGVRPFEQYKASLMNLLRRVAEGEIRAACDLDASIPTDLSDALARALSTNPDDRFESLRDWGAALLPFASEARRTLWQHTFIDTERTMTSPSAPVSRFPAPRRVSVAVESAPLVDAPEPPTWTAPPDSQAITPRRSSPLPNAATPPFGDALDPAESSVSRREIAPTRRADPHELASALKGASDDGSRPPPAQRFSRASAGEPPPTPWLVWVISGIVALLTLAACASLIIHEYSSGKGGQYNVRVAALPAGARFELDGQPVGRGTFQGTFQKTGRVHRLKVQLAGYESVTLVFQDSPPPRLLELEPKKAEPSTDSTLHDVDPNGAKPKNEPPGLIDAAAVDAAKGRPPEVPASDSRSQTAASATGLGTSLPSSPRAASAAAESPEAGATTPPSAKPTATRASASSSSDSANPSEPSAPRPVAGDPPRSRQQPPPTENKIRTGNLDPWAE